MTLRKIPFTHVYILGFSDGVVKVGGTSNLRQRVSGHVSDAHNRCAVLLHQWSSGVADAQTVERAIINLGQFHFPRARGNEYFHADWEAFLDNALSGLTRWGIDFGEPELRHFKPDLPMYENS